MKDCQEPVLKIGTTVGALEIVGFSNTKSEGPWVIARDYKGSIDKYCLEDIEVLI